MSTVDPRQARAQRAEQDEGGTGQALAATGLALLTAGFGVLIAVGFTEILDLFRRMWIFGFFDDAGSASSPRLGRTMLCFVGVFGAVIVRLMAQRAAIRVRGGWGRALQAIPFTTLGILLGSLVTMRTMTPPTTVGVNEDPVFHDPEPWGAQEWMWYRLPLIVPLVLAAVVLLLLVRGIQRVRRQTRTGDLLQHGRRAIGRVIEVSGGSTLVNGMPLLTVSVEFTDHLGTVRYVTKRRPVPLSQLPRVDQRVVVFFDPDHLTDEKRIAFGLGGAEAVDSAAGL